MCCFVLYSNLATILYQQGRIVWKCKICRVGAAQDFCAHDAFNMRFFETICIICGGAPHRNWYVRYKLASSCGKNIIYPHSYSRNQHLLILKCPPLLLGASRHCTDEILCQQQLPSHFSFWLSFFCLSAFAWLGWKLCKNMLNEKKRDPWWRHFTLATIWNSLVIRFLALAFGGSFSAKCHHTVELK